MKKVAATSGHSRSLDEDFFFALSGWETAGKSWLQRAGMVANFYGFLLRLSHEVECKRRIHIIAEA
jgi:hypothetical protein